jgi:hypothetical protein
MSLFSVQDISESEAKVLRSLLAGPMARLGFIRRAMSAFKSLTPIIVSEIRAPGTTAATLREAYKILIDIEFALNDDSTTADEET